MNLIIGGTGKIGTELVKQLTATGAKVRALVRDTKKAGLLKGPGVEIVKGDLGNPKSLDAALKGVNRVFLLSAGDPYQVELQGNLVQAAKRAGIKLLVKLSVYGASPDATPAFMRWHWITEQEIRSSGIPFTFLRPNFFMQNFLGYAGGIAGTGTITGCSRDGKVSMVDVRDIAAVAVAVLTGTGYEGQTYEITGPESLSFADAATRFSSILGKTVTYQDQTPADALLGMVKMGMPAWLADAYTGLGIYFAAGLGSRINPVITALTRKPARTLDGFIRENLEAFRGKVARAA
jgi:uncharacterized protein YbjT (DUF2867 family)